MKKLGNLTWQKASIRLHSNEIAFRGNSQLPDGFRYLNAPIDVFNLFFTDDVIGLIVDYTNRKALAANDTFETTSDEIRKFMGILIFMSVVICPDIDFYWGFFGMPAIQSVMCRNRFHEIKKFLSFADDSNRKRKGEDGYDALFRIRNLADALNSNFDSIPKTERLCVDEQMCATKTKHHLRQYMPAKPHKWGVKLFVLCDSFGFAYR